ncbi:MAG TPA: hypothetical protein VFF30_19820 [Nitrososphaerales archaeon]|nr:hypothetical protein [Nitrososphaerales archaeon]
MPDDEGSIFHQQMTITFGTLGAITFAALVLILQDPKPFTVKNNIFLTPDQSFDVLILVLSCVSLLSLISCLATSFAASGIVDYDSSLAMFGFYSGFVSIFAFGTSILYILGDISTVDGNIFVVFIVVLVILFVMLLRQSMNRKNSVNYYKTHH